MNDSDCPFLRPSRSIADTQPRRSEGGVIGVYCALPMRRVRVPTRAELEVFCRPNQFENCPHYQRYARVR
jgi:hypothetical protein